MPIQRNNLSYIVFIREYNTDCLHQLTSSIVYNTEEDAKEAIKDYELSHKDSKYAIKLIRGEIIESIYKEI
jgi:hypothetical protein